MNKVTSALIKADTLLSVTRNLKPPCEVYGDRIGYIDVHNWALQRRDAVWITCILAGIIKVRNRLRGLNADQFIMLKLVLQIPNAVFARP